MAQGSRQGHVRSPVALGIGLVRTAPALTRGVDSASWLGEAMLGPLPAFHCILIFKIHYIIFLCIYYNTS